MTDKIFSEVTVNISEFKRNPMSTVDSGKGLAIVVLRRNKPVFYCVPTKIYEALTERLGDQGLKSIVKDNPPSEADLLRGLDAHGAHADELAEPSSSEMSAYRDEQRD